MKLLFDENLPRSLVDRLADSYPESSHVVLLGMSQAGDREIWEFARNEGFVVVSKDSDFGQLAVLYAPPPKFVWLRLGNCSVSDIERVLRDRREELEGFEAGPEAFLVVGAAP